MGTIKIRNYEVFDLEECRLLWAELTDYHREIYDDPSIGGNDPGQFFDKHLTSVGSENIWVAVKDERIIGMIGLLVSGEEAQIEPVIVKSNYRNQGVGRKLVSYAIKQAKKKNIRFLNVKPVARNIDAISFFYNTGFQKLGHIQMFIELDTQKQGKWETGLTFLGHNFEF